MERRPASETDTKERILNAAETLFARDGYAGTSLRAVTTEAGVNLASVNYHFGSKEALLVAAFDRLAAPVNAERLALLDDLEARAEAPDLEEVIDAFLGPALRIVLDLGERGLTATRFLGRVAADPTPAVQQVIGDEFRLVSERYLHALSRAVPGLDPAEVAWRFKLVVGVLVYVQSDQTWKVELGAAGTPSDDLAGVLARTVSFAARGFAGPPTDARET